MPNANRGTSMYLGAFSSPDTLNQPLSATQASASAAVPAQWYAPGDVGVTFEYQDKAYTVAILDSGATSANPVGAPAVNNVLFWKNKANRIVTNDFRQSITPTVPGASVAGILRVTPSSAGAGGNVIAMLIRGFGIPVTASTTAIGPAMVELLRRSGRLPNWVRRQRPIRAETPLATWIFRSCPKETTWQQSQSIHANRSSPETFVRFFSTSRSQLLATRSTRGWSRCFLPPPSPQRILPL